MSMRWLSVALGLALLAAFATGADQPLPPTPIRVVMDNNYPPYAFTDQDGRLQGILPDLWRRWEQVTGLKVELTGLDWNEALRRMRTGEFDVIDTIFKTPERTQWLDFTPPYEPVTVTIFFDREISGIHDIASLKDFAVAVKRGDAAVDVLRAQGIGSLIFFPSYEEVIRAAQRGKVNVFVIDQPPALYFLHKYNIRERFKQSAPINTGEFHRAVGKGRHDLLNRVETGFQRIPPADVDAIKQDWSGQSLLQSVLCKPYWIGLMGLLLASLLVLLFRTRALGRRVHRQSAELESAHEQVRLSNEHFETLFETAAEGILVANADNHHFEYANPMIERILGYPAGELIGKSVADIHPADALPQILSGFQSQLRGEKVLTAGLPCRRKDGRIVYADVCAAPVNLNGHPYIMGLFTDITQRVQTENALREKCAEMDRFVYAVSHGLKAPLITFQTYLGFLEKDLGQSDPTDVQRDIAFMQSAANRMKSALDDLLVLSRVGRVNHPPETVSFSNVLDDALRAVAGPIATRGVAIVRPAPDRMLHGDRPLLTEIWQNLIENAVKFMGSQAQPRIELGWEAQSSEIIFQVRDNGIGIDRADQARIFEIFEKLNPSAEGTGLGLALVKRIVELHHGRIWVESDGPGQGCCFKFTLPDALSDTTPPCGV